MYFNIAAFGWYGRRRPQPRLMQPERILVCCQLMACGVSCDYRFCLSIPDSSPRDSRYDKERKESRKSLGDGESRTPVQTGQIIFAPILFIQSNNGLFTFSQSSFFIMTEPLIFKNKFCVFPVEVIILFI